MTYSNHDRWLDTAARIGGRLVASAAWVDGRCTWEVRTPARIPGVRRAETVPAPGIFYQGTSGIAVFLAELYRQTHDVRLLPTIRGALRHAVAFGRALDPAAFGFHAGRVGIGYACQRAAQATGEEEFAAATEELLTSLVGNAHADRGNDVIGGAAGAIPALLAMADVLPPRLTLELAHSLGESLLRRARRGVSGWSWPASSASVRDLTGYAHGASGFAHALLELYAATGDARFRHGAEQAFLYERHHFDPREQNWKDFRHLELSEFLSYGQADVLRAQLRAGETLAPYTPRCMTAWCHGAPGIGLTRLRAYELLGEPVYEREANVAAETTLRAVRGRVDNHSLCHGHLGNCETLIVAAKVLGRPEWRVAAEECADAAREEYELAGRPWPCGVVGSAHDPSLLVGEAGIGYFYLRLHDNATPSVLCPAPAVRIQRVDGEQRVDSVWTGYVDEHFGTIIRVLDRLQPATPIVRTPADLEAGESEVTRAYAAIVTSVAGERDSGRRALFEDAFAVERTRFELSSSIIDFSSETLESLRRLDVDEVSWPTAVLQLADHVAIVRTRCDWQTWLDEAAPAEPPTFDEVGHATAVFSMRGDVHARPLSAFAALVLDSAARPGTVEAIVRRVAREVECDAPDRIADAVLQQVRSAYSASLIRCVDVAREGGTSIRDEPAPAAYVSMASQPFE